MAIAIYRARSDRVATTEGLATATTEGLAQRLLIFDALRVRRPRSAAFGRPPVTFRYPRIFESLHLLTYKQSHLTNSYQSHFLTSLNFYAPKLN